MKAELTLTEKIAKFFGYGYVVNEKIGSREIHKLSNKQKNCKLHKIIDKRYVTEKKALSLIKGMYDGCSYCWNEKSKH